METTANDRQGIFQSTRLAVVKLGSGVLTIDNGLNTDVISAITEQVSELIDSGIQVIMVSSGAVASGMKKMGRDAKPASTPAKQATAAIGQAGLILEYEKAFSRFQKKTAQILLTHNDLVNKKRHLNARNTLTTLLDWKVIPIINENDTVATDELKFGDNDNLSAMIALLLNADVLINLTDIDGLYDRDPRNNPEARFMPVIETIGKSLEKVASSIPGAVGTGGMLSKIKAARKATAAGIPMFIASGKEPDILRNLFSGNEKGTFFVPKNGRMESKKRWLAFNARPEGALTLDQGAVKAILKNGKSLLPSGIVEVNGDFRIGDAVSCQDVDGNLLATGLTNYSASDIRKIRGKKSGEIETILGSKNDDEVIHRNNMAIAWQTETDYRSGE